MLVRTAVRRIAVLIATISTAILSTAGSGGYVGLGAEIPQVAFRTATTQVVLDVVVTGHDGRPIEDLTMEDFEITQEGRKQIINQFDFVKVPLGTRVVSEVQAGADDLPPTGNQKPARESRLFAVVVDDGTLLPPDIAAVKLLVRQLVRRSQPNDVLSLTYVNRSDLSQDFTRDPNRILWAADRVSSALGAGPARGESLAGSIRRTDDLATLRVLSNVLEVLSSSREPRRAILMISRGTYISKGNHWSEWGDLYRDATRAGVPIYSLHAGGLSAPDLGLDLPLEMQTPEQARVMSKNTGAGIMSLQEIAANTGGRAYVNRTNIGVAVDEMVSENGSYYVLGFEPNPYSTKRFQDVKVRVRRLGASVRARKGYSTHVPPAGARTSSLALHLAEGSPGGDIALRGTVAPASPSSDLIVAIRIESEELAALGEDLDFEWIALDPEAKMTGRGSARLKLPALVDRDGAVDIVARLAARDGTRVVRVGVSAVNAQRAGWLHLPLEPGRRRGENIWASPIFLAERGTGSAAVALVGDIAGILPFAPSSQRVFTTQASVNVLCRIVALPDGAPIDVHVARVDGKPEGLSVKPVIRRAGTVVDVVADIPLTSLGAGQYRIEVSAGLVGHRVHRSALITLQRRNR
jgi:VWFA-related protein